MIIHIHIYQNQIFNQPLNSESIIQILNRENPNIHSSNPSNRITAESNQFLEINETLELGLLFELLIKRSVNEMKELKEDALGIEKSVCVAMQDS